VTRRAALLAWAAMVVVPFLFLGVAAGVRWGRAEPGQVTLLFWLTILVSAFDITLSRTLPPRIRPLRAGPEATAVARLLVAWGLCEAAALFPLVTWIITGDPRLLGVFALDMLALVTLYPSEARWESLTPAARRVA
jgi:hypothetical protein